MVPHGPKISKNEGPQEMKEGDWMCEECGNHNFAHRVNCNKCKAVRSGYKNGDWICRGCKNHNFARQLQCKNCSGPRTDGRMGGNMGNGNMMNPGLMMQMMQQMANNMGNGNMMNPGLMMQMM